MPVITRNQRKNIKPVAQPLVAVFKHVEHPVIILQQTPQPGTLFATKIKDLLAKCDLEVGKENKMKVALEIYKLFNQEFDKTIAAEGINKWIRFVSTVFDKIIEFENEYHSGAWLQIEENLVQTFLDELNKTKKYTINLIKNYDGIYWSELISQTKVKIAALRPRRNIKRVNYTYMDTIEPECKYDGITDIWFDLTLNEDPDYVFEEDEDDEEDEDRTRWEKIHPELSAKEKTELKQHLTKLVDHHRVRRSVTRVNYAGMDMNEEDEGQIHIAKRRFEDGKVKYIWKSYALSKANEIGDEDYVDEE